MKDGFIKTAALAPAVKVGDPAYNAAQAAAALKEAAALGAAVAVLPELYLTGYTCGDLFYQPVLQRAALQGLLEVCGQTKELDLVFAIGLPIEWGGKLYNAAAVCCKGRVLGLTPKTWLPNYGEFYEKRWFAPPPLETALYRLPDGTQAPFGTHLLFYCEQQPAFCLGVEICEDLWSAAPPSVQHAAAGATVILNLSASSELAGKAAYRRELVKGASARLMCGYAYAGAGRGESTTDAVFGGHALICENGAVLAETPPFAEDICISEIDVQRLTAERLRNTTFPARVQSGYTAVPFSMGQRETTLTRPVAAHPFIPEGEGCRAAVCEEILAIQSHGLAARLGRVGAKKAVLGVSGGLDSTLALLVCVRAMKLLKRPASDVLAVTLPCFGTTQRTRSNAQILCEELGCTFQCVDIKAAVDRHFSDIGHDPAVRDATYENCQARERTQVLMDMAGDAGGLVVGTGDLSELALGWATYNGDHMSMYGVNAGVPKTLVRYLVAYEAEKMPPKLQTALRDVLDTPVSPELLPPDENGVTAQKTEELVGPYELHDFFLYYIVRWGFGPAKVLRLAEYAFAGAYTRQVLKDWLQSFYRRFFAQQYKRSCMPDGPKVGTVSLSPRGDWRMPSDAVCSLWMRELEEMEP